MCVPDLVCTLFWPQASEPSRLLSVLMYALFRRHSVLFLEFCLFVFEAVGGLHTRKSRVFADGP